MKRRDLLISTAALAVTAALPAIGQSTLSLRDVAKAMQQQPYAPNTTPLAPPFAGLDYNAYRGIRPMQGRTALLPHGDRFAVDLLPPGLYFPDPIKVDKVTPEGLSEIAFIR